MANENRPLGGGESRPDPATLRAIDAEVAEKVMGWRWGMWGVGPTRIFKALFGPDQEPEQFGYVPCASDAPHWIAQNTDEPPRYSTDIAAAFLVVEKLHADGWHFHIVGATNDFPDPWSVTLSGSDRVTHGAYSTTLPLAICRAALALLASPKAVASDAPAPTPEHAPS